MSRCGLGTVGLSIAAPGHLGSATALAALFSSLQMGRFESPKPPWSCEIILPISLIIICSSMCLSYWSCFSENPNSGGELAPEYQEEFLTEECRVSQALEMLLPIPGNRWHLSTPLYTPHITSDSLLYFSNHSLSKPRLALNVSSSAGHFVPTWRSHLWHFKVERMISFPGFLYYNSPPPQLLRSCIPVSTSYQKATIMNHHCPRTCELIYFPIITFKPIGDPQCPIQVSPPMPRIAPGTW